MSRFEQWEKVDLQAGVQRFPVHGGFFTHDALGNRLGLIVTNGNDPVTLTGSIKGFAKLPPHTDDDVQIFEITGAIDGTDSSKAYVDLPEECYYYSGPMTVTIRNIDGNEKTTLASFVGFVDAATDGNIGTPTPGGGGGGYIIDNVPTSGSDNLVKSGGVYSAIQTASQNSSNAINALGETVNDIDDRVDTLETTVSTKIDSSALSNYVQRTDYASAATGGVIRVGSGFNITSAGYFNIKRATASEIKAGQEAYSPIVPFNQHSSVFYGLAKAAGDTTQAESSNAVGTYTTDAKTAIKTMLGITDVDISSLSTRLTTAESNIGTLQTTVSDLSDNVADAEDGIIALESSVSSLGTRLGTAENNITALESSFTSLGTRLTTAEGAITSQGTRLTTAEGSISSQDTRLTTAESDIDGLDTRVTALENGQGPSYVVDDTPTANSNNLVKSGGVYSAINNVSSNVSTLSTSVNTLSTSVNTMQSTVQNNVSGITSLESRVSYLESVSGANVEDITNDVTMVKSSGSNASLQGYEMYKCGNIVTFSITMKATGTVNAGSAMAYVDVTGAPVPVINPRATMYYGNSIIFGNFDKLTNRITVAVLSANLAANSAFMLTFVYLSSDSESEPTNSTNSMDGELI